MSLAQGYFSKPFLAQVAPGQNQHLKNAKWEDAHGDRVKIRIPGKHSSTNELPDDNLPWAIVSKSTSHGNRNGGSTGLWGGEWVIACYMDEAQQIPIIIAVLGNNLSDYDLNESENGTTGFKRINRFNSGLSPVNHQIIGDSTKSLPAQPSQQEFKDASKNPSSQKTSTGVPSEPKITTNPDGSVSVTTYNYDLGSKELEGFTRTGSSDVIDIARKEQNMFYSNETSRLSGGVGSGFS